MITRQFTFFSFILGWSFLIRMGLSPSMGFLLAPIIYLVSGKKYLAYFFLINIITNLPQLVDAIASYYYIMNPLWHFQNQLNMASNDTAKMTVIKGLYTNMTGITPPNSGQSLIGAISIVFIGITCVTLVLVYSVYKSIKMYIRILRRVRHIAVRYHR